MLMAPLVRRSWSVRGQTPVLRQRTRYHQKVSAVAALCILPTRDRIALYFRLHPDANINAERTRDFLEHLQRQLRTPIVLIWDSFQAHKGELINECVHPHSAHLEYLPPYAPELNPVEPRWSHAKYSQLANFVPDDTPQLKRSVRSALKKQSREHTLKRSFFKSARLKLEPALSPRSRK